MNLVGATAVILSVCAFALTSRLLRGRTLKVRLALLAAFTLLTAPSALFTAYYLHVLPEQVWFYSLRAWRGTEFLVVFLGCAAATFASFLPRLLLVIPLSLSIAVSVVPYIKPILSPIPSDAFRDYWQGYACLQSTASTCGPASVTSILRWLGVPANEQEAARAAHSYNGGTEAWYLARYARTKGLHTRFDFRASFSPSVGFPALVGVKFGGAGHFIAVLDLQDDQVTLADPLRGAEHIPLFEFQRRYVFTGFHMVITKGQSR